MLYFDENGSCVGEFTGDIDTPQHAVAVERPINVDKPWNVLSLVAGVVVVALQYRRDQKRYEMQNKCSMAIAAGVTVSGFTYPTTATDQANLSSTILAAQIHGDAAGPFKFWCADNSGAWARREHTAAQIISVGDAVRAHVVAQQDKYETKLGLIAAAATEADIDAVSW